MALLRPAEAIAKLTAALGLEPQTMGDGVATFRHRRDRSGASL